MKGPASMNHIVECLTAEYDFDTINKIVIISTNSGVNVGSAAGWLQTELLRVTGYEYAMLPDQSGQKTITAVPLFLKNSDAVKTCSEADMIILAEKKFRSRVNAIQLAKNTLNCIDKKIDGLLLVT